MNQDQLKELVAREALKHVVEDAVVGVGSGSTVFKFIDLLSERKNRIEGAVAASEASAERLKTEVQKALLKTHAMLRPDQRARLAYLLRSGQLTI